MNTGSNITSYDKIAKLLLQGHTCRDCLYNQMRGFDFVCEKNIATGGSSQKLPKENICLEWTN